MDKPLVTIAMPTYNRASLYLEDALNRAFGQSYDNIEVLVSDNFSTDRTPDIVERFADSRLRFYRQERNVGQLANMNFLIDNANGDYFLMYHDDDQIDRDFIETCVKAAEYKKDVGLILTGARVIDEHGTVLREKENEAQGLPFDDFLLLWFQKGITLFLCSSLFNTNVLRKANGFNPKYDRYCDVAAELLCAFYKGRVDVRECKASFREHANSATSGSTLNSWCKSALELVDLAYSLAPAKANEIKHVGIPSSADRVYRYASEAESKIDQIKGYWRVYKGFGYRYPPSSRYITKSLPFLRYVVYPNRTVKRVKNRIKESPWRS